MTQTDDEAEKLFALANEDTLAVVKLIEAQLNVVYTRAQVLVGISGMVITVTGFSGREIAHTSDLARYLIIIGLAVVLSSTIWVFLRVMTIRWATYGVEKNSIEAIRKLMQYRDKKTIAYDIGGKILACGLVCYGIAVALMLAE